MNITINIDDALSPALAKLAKDMPRIRDVIAEGIAEDYKEFTRQKYLSGQMLGGRTPRRAMAVRKERNGAFVVGPLRFQALSIFETGGVIRPRRKKILRFYIGNQPVFAREVRVPRIPFITRSFARYIQLNRGMKRGEVLLLQEIEKHL